MNPNSLLPNMRLLGLNSENAGRDWPVLTQKIDRELDQLGLDLAEEAVYFFYSCSPEKILKGEGQCFVARSVIGPKREVASPLLLRDWTARPVWQETITGQSLEDYLHVAQRVSEKHAKSAAEFILLLRRELKGNLFVHVDTIFYE